MMRLPANLQHALWRDLEQLERNKSMPYVTSVERIGIEKGIQQGVRQGAAAILLRQIERRFGPPSEQVRERITQADADTLLQWSERILDAATIDEVLH